MATTGWRCIVATVFSQSVPNPQGFARECQTSKGLSATVDYMKLRRKEDRQFIASLNQGLSPQYAIEYRHGNFPEAPHRGYHSADMLFGGLLCGDDILSEAKQLVDAWIVEWMPTMVILPSGYGYHVDHVQVLQATQHLISQHHKMIRYRDTPYVIRYPNTDAPLSMQGATRLQVMRETDEWFKTVGLDAIACYQTQLPFQYKGESAMRETMARHTEWYWAF
jgi:hypothetical protein